MPMFTQSAAMSCRSSRVSAFPLQQGSSARNRSGRHRQSRAAGDGRELTHDSATQWPDDEVSRGTLGELEQRDGSGERV